MCDWEVCCADLIVQFLQNYTIRIEGVGDVCTLATFDFNRHGNEKYGSPTNGQKQDRSKQGKMEKSFLSFVTAYPSWTPHPSGQRMLENLEPFLISSAYPDQSGSQKIDKGASWSQSSRAHSQQRASGSQRMIEMTIQTSTRSSSHPSSSTRHSIQSQSSRAQDSDLQSSMNRLQLPSGYDSLHDADAHRALELFYVCKNQR